MSLYNWKYPGEEGFFYIIYSLIINMSLKLEMAKAVSVIYDTSLLQESYIETILNQMLKV
jgi:hypothetical protein